MFTVHCETCNTTRLLGPRRITGMDNTDQGIFVHFRCHCGAEATILTGRTAHQPAAETVAEPVDEPVPVAADMPAGERVLATCGAHAAA